MNLERAGTLFLMACSPGLGEAEAERLAGGMFAREPSQARPAARKGGPGLLEQMIAMVTRGEEPQPLGTVEVRAQAAKVRSGPSAQYTAIDELCQGDRLLVWRSLGDYVFVSEAEGCRCAAGWMHKYLLRGLDGEGCNG